MVTASGWRIAANLITDFVKSGGDNISYGAFAKGAGDHNVFERNVVLCEYKLRGQAGERIGLSFGGGGTGLVFRRDDGASGAEQISSIMRDNLIAFCSDDGVYLNRAAETVLEHNTLIDTAGIDSRFPETSAEVINNIVDGVIRQRDGGRLQASAMRGRCCSGCSSAGTLHAICSSTLRDWICVGAPLRQCDQRRPAAPICAALPAALRPGPARSTTLTHA
jgi:hypothetical protein